ncbi:hypothetical protein HOR87_gp20 [Marinomonas phage CB5A]|uniref:Uncharacterized protein n=1 Tax=Marinomonas phage CB5A TaxID=2022859 RepID=A0A222G3H0_9CAUD|nr:hypothetical protein HOR87_gp20 [Marinomonas phage CB5A]ASP46282.1 hypothetical protein [Marinomonas phage CB5A]
MNNELGSVTKGLDDVEDTYEAAKFATVTQVARTLVPVMTQEFPIRIKSTKEAHGFLKHSLVSTLSPRNHKHDYSYSEMAARLLGKALMVKVDWSMLNACMWLIGELDGCKFNLPVSSFSFKKVITQKKQPLAMFELWKTASGN